MFKKFEILSKVFGHNNFRAFQEEAVDAILNHQDLLLILPTGGGKSLCYQLPALLLKGTTIVISPLIALMQDQIKSLQDRGINAVMLSSASSFEELNKVYRKLDGGDVKFLYIAPERLNSSRFLDLLERVDVSFFVIDEAHCVSEWGHEFRDDYRRLGILKEKFPNTPVAAFTATATKKVVEDIVKTLKLKNPKILKGKIFRDNLILNVKKRAGNGYKQLVKFLDIHKNESGIVYTFTRKESEKLANFLQKNGYKAKAYHAGLDNSIRDAVYKDFINDKLNIVVATVAFGMGIDKSNIRFIVHISLPKTIENYYQEIGRAGRDGLNSEALLLYNNSDKILRTKLIDDIENEQYKKIAYQKLENMYHYAISSECRHKYIANYFGDSIKSCKNLCDNCTKEESEQIDITTPSLMFLSAIYRTDQSFGQNYIIDLLRGSKSAKIEQNNHTNLSVYGIGKEFSKKEFESISERLFDLNAITRGEFGAIKLTNIGLEIIKYKKTVLIDKDKYQNEEIRSNYKTDIDNALNEFFEDFRKLRAKIAQEEMVPAYIIFSDKTLKEISLKLPQTKEEMLKINGIGEVKFQKYGEKFLELCKKIKEIKKPLSKTYMQTLKLIKENKSIQEIAIERNFSLVTILNHIKTLYDNEKIDKKTKENLIKDIKNDFNPDILKWIKKGLEIESYENLKQLLIIYGLIY